MARIFVVDDDPDGSDVLCRFLRRAGHHAVCVSDGREALAGLPEVNPDVVVLDVMMPGMDGAEFLDVLRNYRRGQMMPVIVLTGMPDGPRVERLRRLGVRHIFQKAGFDYADLLACIDELTLGASPPRPGTDTPTARA